MSNARYGLIAARAVAEQQGEVMHLARLTGLDDEPDACARLLADEVMVHGRGDEQRGNRRDSSASAKRSERMMRLAPSAIASLTCVRTLSIAMRKPSPPSATG